MSGRVKYLPYSELIIIHSKMYCIIISVSRYSDINKSIIEFILVYCDSTFYGKVKEKT